MNVQGSVVRRTGEAASVRDRSGARGVAWLLALAIGAVAPCALAQPAAGAEPATMAAKDPETGQNVTTRARKEGPIYVVDATFTVAASQDLAWDVLTDFDQMAQILSSVDASKIVDRKGNEFEVEQRSHGSAGPVRVSLNNVRRVTLVPKTEIRSRLVSSDSLKSSDFTTRLVRQGEHVRVDVRGTFVPAFLASAVISTEGIETQVGRQYTELRDEILRRKTGAPRPACLATKDCP